MIYINYIIFSYPDPRYELHLEITIEQKICFIPSDLRLKVFLFNSKNSKNWKIQLRLFLSSFCFVNY